MQRKNQSSACPGPVDSSVSALAVTTTGYQVDSLVMKKLEKTNARKCVNRARIYASMMPRRFLRHRSALNCNTVNFASGYWQHVFELFLSPNIKPRWDPESLDIVLQQRDQIKTDLPEFAAEDVLPFISLHVITWHSADVHGGTPPAASGGQAIKTELSSFIRLHEQIAQSLFPFG